MDPFLTRAFEICPDATGFVSKRICGMDFQQDILRKEAVSAASF